MYVKPRFTDGTFEEPLPLEDHFADIFLGATAPRVLAIEGARGSGLTTALDVLAAAAERAGRTPVFARELAALDDPRAALKALARPEAILFADLSVLPLARDRELLRALGPAFLRARAFVVAGTRLDGFLRWAGISPRARVELASWGRDELIELLSLPDYVEHRARIHAGLVAMEGSHSLLRRPRTARWLVDAACRLEANEPFTRSRLFASFLDELSPAATELARSSSAPTAADILASSAPLEDTLALCHVRPCSARALASGRTLLHDEGSALALEGLHDFLRAGAVVKKIAEDVVPPIDARSLPFVAEMMTPALEERLDLWLAREAFPGTPVAATVLHARGRSFEKAKLDGASLDSALLARADFRRAKLRKATFRSADLTGARLDHAILQLSHLDGVTASGASFDKAFLFSASCDGALLVGASFRRAVLVRSFVRKSQLDSACFAGAILGQVTLLQCDLSRADFSDASMRQARLTLLKVDEADFTGADLREAKLRGVDLRRARFAPASLAAADFEQCSLAELDLANTIARGTTFMACDMSTTSFRGANLQGARFQACTAHDAVFDDADLRGAVFDGCNFHAGSSRAGLLIGKPALEGNKTGFYTEGTTDDAWSSPDSIRQASFRGANLNCATFKDTDVFRVDFRGALLDPPMRAELIRLGAIVD